ncbi:Uncharacterised protein [Mycobacteroides abscessus subsp. abscessus]|nr:Uncharacterised protein [Mycobacteroides abscessus subsp. abscessus]
MLTRGQRLGGFGVEVGDPAQVVAVLELAAGGVQAPAADTGALGHDHPFSAGVGHHNLGGHRVRFVLDVEDAVFRQPSHPGEQHLGVARDELGPSGQVGVQPPRSVIVEGQNVITGGLDQPQPLQFMQFFWHRLGQILGLAPILGGVIQFPHVVVEGDRLFAHQQPRRLVLGDRGPALVVDPSISEHLEVLRFMPVGRLAVVERVQHAGALDGMLLNAVDEHRLWYSSGLQDRGRNVDDVMELATNFGLRGDALGPVHDRAVAGPAPV